MNHNATITEVAIRHFHIFCGLGGGAKGFNKGTARVGNLRARFECIGGIDVDPAAIRDFSRIAGVPGTCMDLFNREQFTAFYGKEPPPGWREASPVDIRRAAGGKRPHIVFLSAPCKGFSGLLAESLSRSKKYQALNGLTLRGVWLMLEAWADDPPELIIFENVPRIATRGRPLLDQINALLRRYGYAVAETKHDCGRIGGLAQSRKRFLLVARHIEKVPPFLYEPPQRQLRAVGDILEKLPLPGDPAGGVMHRVPLLQWRTWVRLAFVAAGSDWRSLNDLRVEDGVLADYGIVPQGAGWRDDILGVLPWTGTAGTVIGNAGPTTGRFSVADPREFERRNDYLGVSDWSDSSRTVTGDARPSKGAFSVADPRMGQSGPRFNNVYRVVQWAQPSPAVTGGTGPTAGGIAVADPRGGHFPGGHGVCEWDQPAGTVAGESYPSNGKFAVADPRPADGAFTSKYRVTKYDEPTGTCIAASTTGQGAFAVADPRMAGANHGVLGVRDWEEPSGTITAAGRPMCGSFAVADPRMQSDVDYGQYGVRRWDQPTGTITSQRAPGQGHFSVADPRCNWSPKAHHNKLRVVPYDEPTGAITGSSSAGHGFTSGAMAVADPRPGYRDGTHTNILAVTPFDAPSKTVTGADHVTGGALSVADPRPDYLRGGKRSKYQTAGNYGVQPWGEPCGAIAAAGQHDNGRWSVADPRVNSEAAGEPAEFKLPKPEERLVAVIQAVDGTWHRPFTTLELAALQSLVDPEEMVELEGLSDSAWRERIGNAVPPDAAEAIASVMGRTLLMAWSGNTFVLSSEPIWVQPIALALSVDLSSHQWLD